MLYRRRKGQPDLNNRSVILPGAPSDFIPQLSSSLGFKFGCTAQGGGAGGGGAGQNTSNNNGGKEDRYWIVHFQDSEGLFSGRITQNRPRKRLANKTKSAFMGTIFGKRVKKIIHFLYMVDLTLTVICYNYILTYNC